MLTDEDRAMLSEVRERCEAATPPPWIDYYESSESGNIMSLESENAALRAEADRLAAEVERLRDNSARRVREYKARCIFCTWEGVDIFELRVHSATCAEHPAVKESTALRAELEFTEARRECTQSALDRVCSVRTAGPGAVAMQRGKELSENAKTFAELKGVAQRQEAEIERLRDELAATPPTLEWLRATFGVDAIAVPTVKNYWSTQRIKNHDGIAWDDLDRRAWVAGKMCPTRAAVLSAAGKGE